MPSFDQIAMDAMDRETEDGLLCAGLQSVRKACAAAASLAVSEAHEIFVHHSIRDVVHERVRQIQEECYDAPHDRGHIEEELAQAAACYALPSGAMQWLQGNDVCLWPFERAAWKPSTRRRDLVKAAALILAEIDRLDELEQKP